MKFRLSHLAVLAAIFCVTALPALAHHARSGYDLSKTLTLKAVVTRLEWTNPHTLIYFDVTDDTGRTQSWHAITGSPSRLTRTGWTSDTLKVGDQITITGNPTKAGTPEIWMTRIVLPDGRELPRRR